MKLNKTFRSFWILLCFAFCGPQIAGAGICTTYDYNTNTAHIPSLKIGEEYYRIDLKQTGDVFQLTDYGDAKKLNTSGEYDASTMLLHIPCVDLNGSTYWVDFNVKIGDNIAMTISDYDKYSDDLVINEILAKDANDGNDWIELYVKGSQPVNLAEYTLTDEDSDHEKNHLPAVTLNHGQFFLIQATAEAPTDGSASVPFKLGAADAVILYKGERIIDLLAWENGDAPAGYSYGRLPDGSGIPQTLSISPGAVNVAGPDLIVDRPEGWKEESHGDAATPSYDTVFPESIVKRIDLRIDSAAWQAMLADMTDLYGEFGDRSTMPGMEGNFNDGLLPEEGEGLRPQDGMRPPAGAEGRPEMNRGEDSKFATENPVWKPCTFEFEGKIWEFVGVRFKGNSSLASAWGSGIMKLPFRFDFDKFEDENPEIDNQRFYGFEKLALSSNYADDSMIREKVAADIFRDAGVPAPRTAFYRLFIDHGDGPGYFGLYTMVEIPDTPMFVDQFTASGGNLYKPEGTGATFASYDEASFDKETNENDADYSDVQSLYDALHADRTDAARWRTELEKTIDTDGFLLWLAVNTVIQNWDTYGNMSHNYYLYNDPGDGKIHWIPWDNNMAMMSMREPLTLSLDEVNESWPLIRFLIDDPLYYAKYIAYVEETAKSVFNQERMAPIYRQAHELISPYVIGANGEKDGDTLLSSAEAFDDELDFLISNVQDRYDAAMEFVAR